MEGIFSNSHLVGGGGINHICKKLNLRLCFSFDVASRWIACGRILLFFFGRFGISTSFGTTTLFTFQNLNCCFKSLHCVSSKLPVSLEIIKYGLQFSVEPHFVYFICITEGIQCFSSIHQPNTDTGGTTALLDSSKFYHNSTLRLHIKKKQKLISFFRPLP